ncbi:MAG: MgtC/SapB family protein [Burkholderiales bacterium]
MPSDELSWLKLAVALGIGLMIGLERERRKGAGPARSVAGIRTFAVAALLGAVGMMLGGEILLAVVAGSVAVLTAIGYHRTLRDDPGLTTEIALLLTLLLGALAMHQPPLAAGLAVVLVVLLAARNRIHHFVRRVLTAQELEDALMLAAATLVVLPLVPDRHIGPYAAINPRITWTIVVLMLAIGAAGHVAVRMLGARFGLAVAGFVSGFVSSAATIGSMGERAARNPALLRPAAAGAVMSTVATLVQMTVMLAAASMDTLRTLTLPLGCAGVMAVAYGALFAWETARHPPGADDGDHGRAFSFRTALLFALSITAILFISAAMVEWMGAPGLFAAAAVTGFADAHSTAVSAGSLVAAHKLDTAQAAVAVLAGLTTNTVTKIVIAAINGRRFALQVVPGLLLTIAAAWLGWLFAP